MSLLEAFAVLRIQLHQEDPEKRREVIDAFLAVIDERRSDLDMIANRQPMVDTCNHMRTRIWAGEEGTERKEELYFSFLAVLKVLETRPYYTRRAELIVAEELLWEQWEAVLTAHANTQVETPPPFLGVSSEEVHIEEVSFDDFQPTVPAAFLPVHNHAVTFLNMLTSHLQRGLRLSTWLNHFVLLYVEYLPLPFELVRAIQDTVRLHECFEPLGHFGPPGFSLTGTGTTLCVEPFLLEPTEASRMARSQSL